MPVLSGALGEVCEIFAGAGGFEVGGRDVSGGVDLDIDYDADDAVNGGERFG